MSYLRNILLYLQPEWQLKKTCLLFEDFLAEPDIYTDVYFCTEPTLQGN